MELFGFGNWAGRAVFGLHVVFGLAMFAFGATALTNGQLGAAGFNILIGLMVLIVGRSAGRIAGRR